MRLRTVADTNVVIASRNSDSPESPNREFFRRWIDGGFTLLYSLDVVTEYAGKLLEFGIDEAEISGFLTDIVAVAEKVEIEWFHLRHYPDDQDDVGFLLCAVNGSASHLVTYDEHLLSLNRHYEFTISEPVPFLRELRASSA